MTRKVLKQKRLSRNSTTTNRHSTKKTTTFCVFLLTGYLYPLILRFQIRGTWKRQRAESGMDQGPCEPTKQLGFKAKKSSAKYLPRARI